MDNSTAVTLALKGLLRASDEVLACAEADCESLERYQQNRQEAFSHLHMLVQNAGWGNDPEQAKLIKQVLEKHSVLLQRLERQRQQCRNELTAVLKTQQALDSYATPAAIHLVERGA
jgi:hypothetical protein